VSGVYDAIVIGAGHNGLVAAAYLARAGRRVVVLERRDVIGGSTVTEEFHPGFRADVGPHRMHGLHPSVTAELELATHGLRVEHPDPAIVAPLANGSHLALRTGVGATQDEIAKFSQRDAARWPEFVGQMSAFAKFLGSLYEQAPPVVPPGSRGEQLQVLKLAARARRQGRERMPELLRTIPMSAAELVGDWFESQVLQGTLAARAITGLSQGPMAAGTAFHLLHGVASGGEPIGATVVPSGGMDGLVKALAAAASAQGVEIRTSQEVERIAIDNGGTAGVVLSDGSQVESATVLSNADPGHTLLDLLEPDSLTPDLRHAVRNIRFRGVCARVQLALGELPVFRGLSADGSRLHGCISISPSVEYLERAYDASKYGRVSEAPYLEAVIPSLRDPDLAPPGRHVMSVLVQYAPYELRDGTWNEDARTELAEVVIDTLGEYAPNLPGAVEASSVVTPVDYERVYGMRGGDPHHGEMTLDQALFMRPVPGWAGYRLPPRGLYLCGAGAHPGGGVTGIPGRNAARAVLQSRSGSEPD
jgi:phytoene dehydrogenase-like protein